MQVDRLMRQGMLLAVVLLMAIGGLDASGDPPFSREEIVVRIPLDAAGQVLDGLIRGGYTIDAVSRDQARLYVSQEEFAALQAAGYAPVRLPHPAPAAEKAAAYHSYATLSTDMAAWAASYPLITRLVSIGQSVQGRELWALLITDNPDSEEDEPEFKYISTMHGDEPLGTELCCYLIELLLTSYGADARLTALVEETEIWILPLMNPDGFENARRYNANGYDLNRSFPVYDRDFF